MVADHEPTADRGSIEPLWDPITTFIIYGFRRTPAGALILDGPVGDPHVRAMLDRHEEGMAPRDDDLAGSPKLESWGPCFAGRGLALFGTVSDHPTLGSRDMIVTSQLLSYDGGGRWARTLSRWYRLGRPWLHGARTRS